MCLFNLNTRIGAIPDGIVGLTNLVEVNLIDTYLSGMIILLLLFDDYNYLMIIIYLLNIINDY